MPRHHFPRLCEPDGLEETSFVVLFQSRFTQIALGKAKCPKHVFARSHRFASWVNIAEVSALMRQEFRSISGIYWSEIRKRHQQFNRKMYLCPQSVEKISIYTIWYFIPLTSDLISPTSDFIIVLVTTYLATGFSYVVHHPLSPGQIVSLLRIIFFILLLLARSDVKLITSLKPIV